MYVKRYRCDLVHFWENYFHFVRMQRTNHQSEESALHRRLFVHNSSHFTIDEVGEKQKFRCAQRRANLKKSKLHEMHK